MAHQMALVKMTMGTANAVTTITYDGNTRAEKYRSTGTTSTTSKADFDNFTPLTESSTYYLIVKPKTAYTLRSGYKVTTIESNQSPIYQWTQSITNSELSANSYKACSPTPTFRNFARLYSYTGTCQTFTPLYACKHSMECWGARGGQGTGTPISAYGKGAYTYGKISLSNLNNLYIYVGQGSVATNNSGAWNGGGYKGAEDKDGAGGGATDIRLMKASTTDNTKWYSFDSMKSRIMVASGGGGCDLGGMGGRVIFLVMKDVRRLIKTLRNHQ